MGGARTTWPRILGRPSSLAQSPSQKPKRNRDSKGGWMSRPPPPSLDLGISACKTLRAPRERKKNKETERDRGGNPHLTKTAKHGGREEKGGGKHQGTNQKGPHPPGKKANKQRNQTRANTKGEGGRGTKRGPGTGSGRR